MQPVTIHKDIQPHSFKIFNDSLKLAYFAQ